MPKYEVTIKEVEEYLIVVEAENEEEAESIAREKIDSDKDSYFNGSDELTPEICQLT